MSYHKISEKHLDEFIKISEKGGHKYETREDARALAQNLVSLVGTLVEIGMEERKRESRLEQQPLAN